MATRNDNMKGSPFAVTSKAAATTATSSRRIRANFLTKLGIDEKSLAAKPEQSGRSLLGRVRATHEPLKYKEYKPQKQQQRWSPWARLFGGGKQQQKQQRSYSLQPRLRPSPSFESLSSTSTDKSSRSGKAARRLTFHEEVKVVPIPMRDEYSERIRDRLWSNPEEIRANAERNTLEFRSEGSDWRKVLEDENMYTCIETGELIHPVHCDAEFTEGASS